MEYDSSKRVVSRPHMPMSERAKIFMPFDALKGYREALRERERQALAVERRELTEEQRERLSAQVAALERGVEVEVTHFVGGHYEACRGTFGGIDEGLGAIVVDGRRVEMGDVVAVTRVEG